MREIFALPMIGHRADGSYACSAFEWGFHDAMVRAADAWISIDAPLIAGLAPRQCAVTRSATFVVTAMRWRLSWPAACRF
jgi:hypothetical protein